jgi:membrane dipeptidase
MTSPWIDGHIDLAYFALVGRDLTTPCDDPARACVSLPDLAAGRVRVAFATVYTKPVDEPDEHAYTYPRNDADAAHAAGVRQLDFYRNLAATRDVRLIHEFDQIDLADDHPASSAVIGAGLQIILLMEGADPIRSPQEAAWWWEQGVRFVGLTWARGTRYAGGNYDHGPLTPAGRDLVAALDECGFVHDASHLSDQAFEGLIEHARGPVVATHSNSRAIIGGDNQRHLPDDQIRAIADRDGIVGLNLYTNFLVQGRRATIEDCVEHVMHVCELMGHRRGVALGSDADGGFAPPEMPAGLEHPRDYGRLLVALGEAGFDDDDLHGFACENWMRFLRRVL